MNELQIRLMTFSVSISNHTDELCKKNQMEPFVKQLNRAASSVGANYSEAQSASTRKDFHNKVRISLKEARETEFWLRFLLEKTKEEELENLVEESVEIIKILTTIARKTDPDETHQ